MTAPTFRTALGFWSKLGWISFGGPAGQIALMHRELVERRRWIDEPRFLHALNFCMLLPGPEAQQLATYVGWLLHGTRGAVAAGALFVLPSIAVLWTLAAVYVTWGNAPLALAALAGIKPTVVAIVVEAVVRIGRRTFRHPLHLVFAAGAFVALRLAGTPFPAVVAAAALGGLAAGRFVPGFAPRRMANEPESQPPEPRHRPSARRTARLLAALLVLWAAPLALFATTLDRALPVARQLYLFFTQAAFVTFGGAYAVLTYVAQIAVETFGWLAHGQMIDGLALAETTPGPLVMVLEFVGFLAGWNHPGALTPLVAATVGALLTVWATFLPCFAFILLGAPHVEALRGRRALGAALAGVTAAVVGVILNLGVVFGLEVLLPAGQLDGAAFAVALAAFVALARFGAEAHWVVLGGAICGLLLQFAGG